MNNHRTVCCSLTAILCAVAMTSQAWSQELPREYQEVLKALGKQGDFKANVLKINFPRKDLNVIVDGVATPTPFGFGGWLAMTKGPFPALQSAPPPVAPQRLKWLLFMPGFARGFDSLSRRSGAPASPSVPGG